MSAASARLVAAGMATLLFCAPASISGTQAGLGLAVLGGAWGVWRARKVPRTPLDAPVLALLATTLLSALFAPDPLAAVRKSAGIWSVLTLYLVAGWFDAPEALARILRWFVPTAVLLAVYGAVQHFSGWNPLGSGGGPLQSLELAGRTVYFPRGGFSHYQTYANVFFILFCLALALALAARGRGRAVLGACAALLGVAVLLTFTRGIWVSLATALALFVWVFARRHAAAGALCAAAALLLALALPSSLRARALSMADLEENVERLLLWETTWNMVRDRPLLGVGLGNYRRAQEAYVREAVPMPMSGTHAHNIWLQAAAERGVLGLLALAWLAAALLRRARAAERRLRPGGGVAHALAAGALAALLGFFVDGLVQNNFGDSQVALLLWLLAGVVVVCDHAARAPRRALAAEVAR